MASQGWAPYVAAIGAVIAAALAAINLVITGRRENLSWVRSALEGAFVDFLTASYNQRGASKHLFALMRGSPSRHTEAEWRNIAIEAHEAMLDGITRLRVLASDDTAELAWEVMRQADLDIELIYQGKFDEYEATIDERRDEFLRVRDLFTARARKLLRIRHAL
jgi:hypothetical protein